jgi:group I intron endonuclease
MPSGIYIIRNTESGKCYIGSAINIAKRLARHMWMLRNNQHPSKHLQASFLKYGDAAFETGTLEECDAVLLLEREQHWIDTMRPAYNKRPQANNNLGFTQSETQKTSARERGRTPEQIARIAEGSKRAWKDPEKRAARVAGIKAAWTDEKRQAVSEKQKGIDKGEAARIARWSKEGASERASEALRLSHAERPRRSIEDIKAAVEETGHIFVEATGHKSSDMVRIRCEKHDGEEVHSVSKVMNRGRRCRLCGFERSSEKQKGISIPGRGHGKGGPKRAST